MSENITASITENTETITATITEAEEVITATINELARGPAGSDATVTNATVGAVLTASTAKTTPVDADTLPLSDSAASNALKKVTWANIKATLLAYFTTLFPTRANNLSDLASASTARTNLGLVIGTDVLAPAGNGSGLTGLTSSQITDASSGATNGSVTLKVAKFSATGGLAGFDLSTRTLKLGNAVPIAATGILTFSGQPSGADFYSVAGTTFGFYVSGAHPLTSSLIGATLADTLDNAVAVLTTYLTASVVPSRVGSTIVLTAVTPGVAGNSIALTESSSVMTLSSATLTGGAAESVATVKATNITADRAFEVPNAAGTLMLTSAIGVTVQAYDADLTTWAGITPGANVGTALAVAVGSAGAFVTFNGALGTPSSGSLANCTGLPISTGISGLATGVSTFLATPSSANLLAAVTDETGTGSLVFGTSPTIATPAITGIATIVYSDNAFANGITVKNSSTGTNSLTGITIQDSSGNNVGYMQYCPTNFVNAGLQNTVIFGSIGAQKVGFVANAGASVGQDIYFKVHSTATVSIHITGSSGGVSIGTTTDAGATNLLVAGTITASSTLLASTTIELGHATDTTISRVSAGKIAVEGVNVVTTSSTDTLTNKTLTSPTLTTPALGTPSALVVTNATGTASININGTVGATTANTGAFTTTTMTGAAAVPITATTSSAEAARFVANNQYSGFRVCTVNTTNGTPYVSLCTGAAANASSFGTQKAFFAYWGDTAAYASVGYGGSSHAVLWNTTSGGVTIGGSTTDAGATNLLVVGKVTATAGLVYGTFTVGTFPTTTYLEAVVTDALSPVQGATVAAGGSAKCKVMYNGSAKIVTAVL